MRSCYWRARRKNLLLDVFDAWYVTFNLINFVRCLRLDSMPFEWVLLCSCITSMHCRGWKDLMGSPPYCTMPCTASHKSKNISWTMFKLNSSMLRDNGQDVYASTLTQNRSRAAFFPSRCTFMLWKHSTTIEMQAPSFAQSHNRSNVRAPNRTQTCCNQSTGAITFCASKVGPNRIRSCSWHANESLLKRNHKDFKWTHACVPR